MKEKSSPLKRLHGRSARYDATGPIPIRVSSGGEWKSGLLHNLSKSGAFISLPGDLWTGEEIKIVFETPRSPGGYFEIHAVAIWESRDRGREQSTRNGYGVLFRHDSDAGERVTQLMDHLIENSLLYPTEDNA